MNRKCRQLLTAAILMIAMALSFSTAIFASDDNSLASLGIKTEGVTVTPEFVYDTWEYNVEVPAGTTTLELEPHTTNPSATLNSVTGTTLADDGTGTVVITVTSESGNAIEYVLHVTTARGDVDPAEAIAANESSAAVTIDTEVVQSEVETEDPRYVKVDRNSLEDAEKTIEKLQDTITEQRSHISMLTYVLYALIAVSIIFLFIVISQLLRRRDLAQELALYKQDNPYHSGEGYVAEDGWGEWGDEDVDHSGKRGRKNAPVDDGWDDEPVNQATSWADEQIGTPVKPPRHSQRPSQRQYQSGDQRQYQSGDPRSQSRGQKRSSKNSQQGGRPQNGQQQGSRPQGGRPQNGQQQSSRQQGSQQQGSRQQGSYPQNGRSQKSRRQGGYPQNGRQQGAGNADETRRYQAVQPVHQGEVPKDVTRDLTRVNKAEAKAMKKAAAAEGKKAAAEAAKREQEAKKASRQRAEEAKRQAQEAQRLEQEQEAARAAQEEALQREAAQRAELEAEAAADNAAAEPDKGKNVKIDIIDL